MLPLLEGEFVQNGMMTKEQFLAGYGLTQAMPGITIYIRLLYRSSVKRDAWSNTRNNCDLSSCFLTRYWCFTILEQCEKNIFHTRRITWSQCRCCWYFNCCFYDPIWTSTIMNAVDFVFASLLFCLLAFWKTPPWVIVILGAFGGYILSIL